MGHMGHTQTETDVVVSCWTQPSEDGTLWQLCSISTILRSRNCAKKISPTPLHHQPETLARKIHVFLSFTFLHFHLKVAAEIERRQTSRAGVASEAPNDSRFIFCPIFVSLLTFILYTFILNNYNRICETCRYLSFITFFFTIHIMIKCNHSIACLALSYINDQHRNK